jgi:hypothetical protein
MALQLCLAIVLLQTFIFLQTSSVNSSTHYSFKLFYMLFRPTLSDVVIQDIHYLNDPSILIVIHYSFVIHSVLLLYGIH